MTTTKTIHLVFTPKHVDQVPDNAEPVVLVRFARRKEEIADAAAVLQDRDRAYSITWIDRGGHGLTEGQLRHAEARLAEALAVSLTKGQARRVRVYSENVTDLDLPN